MVFRIEGTIDEYVLLKFPVNSIWHALSASYLSASRAGGWVTFIRFFIAYSAILPMDYKLCPLIFTFISCICSCILPRIKAF